LISPDFLEVFPETRDPDIQGITASSFSLGNLVGCLLAALLGDRLGRKNTLRWGALISAIGAVLQMASVNLSMLILGRVINGVGNGMLKAHVIYTSC
jgi:MFS family permease